MGVQDDSFSHIFQLLQGIPGDAIEIGVYKGDSARVIRGYLPAERHLTLIDTFSGHSSFTEGKDDKEHFIGRYNDNDLEAIQALFKDSKTSIGIGDICSATKVILGGPYCFAHIDVDNYEPTKAAINFVLPRMSPGGIIRFDDYGIVCGATAAVDELIGADKLKGKLLFV